MLKELLLNKANEKEIKDYIASMHPFDIANQFKELDEEDQEALFKVISYEDMADILIYLENDDAAEILENQSLEAQVNIISHLDNDDAADIINELDDSAKKDLIDVLDKNEEVLKLINFEEETAGSYMTNNIVIYKFDVDVKKATKLLIKKADEFESIQTIFVVDDESNYLGQISLKNLLKAKSPLQLIELIEEKPTVNIEQDVLNLGKHIKHYGAYDIPVVDNNNKLVGAITVDDVLDIFKDEIQEDLEKLFSLPDTDFEENVFKKAIHRLPWLIILMVLSIPIALATQQFEEILSSVIILALFQPLILDSGGDVASQTLAITLLSLNNKSNHALVKNGIKEIISGMISGFVMGLLAFLATIVMVSIMNLDDGIMVGFVVGLSLFLTVAISPLLGFLIPTILHKLKLDPAVASGPFITTLIDLLSVFIYLGLATLMLGGMIHA